MIFENTLTPIMLSAGPLDIRWYGLMFAGGLLLNFILLQWIFKRQKYSLEHLESLALYLFFGLVIGARLGEVLFYEPAYYFANPSEIIKIWHGGLASHGAAIGLFLAYWIWCRRNKVVMGKYVDALAIGIPISAAAVRIGNFFNSEIIGTFTNGNWGVIFNGEGIPRHPAQLYEAVINILVFGLLFVLYKNRYKKTPRGFFIFLYLLLYFGGRFFSEFFKDLHGLPESFPLSTGQVLSLVPVLISVIYFIWFYPKQKKRST